VYWLCANKISLNVNKTELIPFKTKNKYLTDELKIKLNGVRLSQSPFVTYLGIKIDENLCWKNHLNDLSLKLNRANAMLSKVRYYVQPSTLRSVYYAIFNSHLTYSCLTWAQNASQIKRISVLQRKALRLMKFLPRDAHANPLFHDLNIVKFVDHVKIENCLFINRCFNDLVPSMFKDWFSLLKDLHTYETRGSLTGALVIPHVNTKRFGRFSFTNSAINCWNYLQKKFPEKTFFKLKVFELKSLLNKYFIKSYFEPSN